MTTDYNKDTKIIDLKLIIKERRQLELERTMKESIERVNRFFNEGLHIVKDNK